MTFLAIAGDSDRTLYKEEEVVSERSGSSASPRLQENGMYEMEIIPTQTLVSGGTLTVPVHTIIGKNSSPSVYLQTNIHGPEILGSAVLVQLIEHLVANWSKADTLV